MNFINHNGSEAPSGDVRNGYLVWFVHGVVLLVLQRLSPENRHEREQKSYIGVFCARVETTYRRRPKYPSYASVGICKFAHTSRGRPRTSE